MAIKTWGQNYRYPAIQASIRACRRRPGRPVFHPGSFCLPVGEEAVWRLDAGLFDAPHYVLVLGLGDWGLPDPFPRGFAPGSGSIRDLALVSPCDLLHVRGGRSTASSPFLFYDRIVHWLIGGTCRSLLRRLPFSQMTGAMVFGRAKLANGTHDEHG